VIEVRLLGSEGTSTTWEVVADGRPIGTATTGVRRERPLLTGLDVPVDDAPRAYDRLLAALRELGHASMSMVVRSDDPVLTAAIEGRGLDVGATQMLLHLDGPVTPPARVELRPMSAAEFDRHRAALVTGYAQDLLDAGAVDDLESALAASEASARELLPDGASSTGQHLWTAYDGEVPVGILWVFVDGEHGYIYDIEVREDQRRRGYGRELLDAAAVAAAELGAVRLGLNVFGFNDVAQSMYEKAGYLVTERTYRVRL
jgi:ribosomal protein S18 acetylase RimI-like enzyme